jgi:hypothetical protein
LAKTGSPIPDFFAQIPLSSVLACIDPVPPLSLHDIAKNVSTLPEVTVLMRLATALSVCFLGLFIATGAIAQADPPDTSRGDATIAAYFAAETAQLSESALAEFKTLEQWKAKRGELHEQLMEMLGLSPLPEKTDLKPQVTGRLEEEEFVVEKIQFQSRPGLYVTGNLYLPKVIEEGEKLPTILYVCGHGREAKGDISFGNKTHYQHHGAWFARNGYACLTIDTLQLGEIEGLHHGTHRMGMWWWLSRGYTPAGVEAWNCIRALDYLETRPEVDAARFGVTGRSGGGAYSWWIAAADERIKVAVPVAGITDLQNHVVDGCVEGHCDCMYMVNTYRWDYPMLAALVAPRPLLISNTDSDRIFPLDGVYRTFEKVRSIYRLYGKAEDVALNITAGPHKDTQELRTHAFRWFNHYLKHDDALIEHPARPFFETSELRVFTELPKDELNTTIQETFVAPVSTPEAPKSAGEWTAARQAWLKLLKEKSFRAWPQQAEALDVREAFAAERDGVSLKAYDFTSQGAIRLRLYVAERAGLEKPDLVVLNVLNQRGWNENFLAPFRVGFAEQLKDEQLPPESELGQAEFKQMQQMFASFKWTMAFVAPRGVGPTQWNTNEKKQTQIQRRFYLLGQTLDGMQTYDIRRAVQALRELPTFKETPLWLQSEGAMAGNALYAALFEPNITRLDLNKLPLNHRNGPTYLNVDRILTMPQAVAMAAEQSRVVVYQDDAAGWEYPQAVVENLGWEKKHLQIRKLPQAPDEAAGK